VRVTNHSNGKTVTVTINDRGPFVRGRIVDLTPAGARALGFSGLTRVTLEVVS
jgi:rare lipoprotein A